jgi:hypothetical protein
MFGTYKYTRMYLGYIVILFSLQFRNAVHNLYVGVEVCDWVRERMNTGIAG